MFNKIILTILQKNIFQIIHAIKQQNKNNNDNYIVIA